MSSSVGVGGKRCGRRAWPVALALAVAAGVAHADVPGDANCDGVVDSGEVHALLARIFGDGQGDCATADVNADGVVGAADVVGLNRSLVPPAGPVVTVLALAAANGAPLSPLGVANGAPVFFRNTGSGFQLVVEGKTGLSKLSPGTRTFDFDSRDPSRRPDIQIESSLPLGDGSAAVCDGGVPAFEPPDFGPSQAVANALNDLGCHFSAPATSPGSACTQDSFGRPRFMAADTEVQMCLLVARDLELSAGETVLTVRLRDTAGNVGPTQRLVVRVGSGPIPPTFTASPTASASRTPTHTATRTTPPSATPTATRTSTPSRTATRTATPRQPTPSPTFALTATQSPTGTLPRTGTPSATATRTPATPPSHTPSPTRTPSLRATPTRTARATPTATPLRSASATPSPTATRSATRTPTQVIATSTPTRSRTPTGSPTRTATPSRTPTPSRTSTRTPTRTPFVPPTVTRTSTRTPTRTPTPTQTFAGPAGPIITYFGVTRADDTAITPDGTTAEGVPIFFRPNGAGFSLIIEGKPGLSGAAVGRSAYQQDLSMFPDLQVQVSRPLGNGSPAVCDRSGATAGGVPAINPSSFSETQVNVNIVNDLTCRFLDGTGIPQGRGPNDACILLESGDFRFGSAESTVEFCGFITGVLEFLPGDTVVTARLRDVNGHVGPPARIVLRTSQ